MIRVPQAGGERGAMARAVRKVAEGDSPKAQAYTIAKRPG
jgi:hypothetical protein